MELVGSSQDEIHSHMGTLWEGEQIQMLIQFSFHLYDGGLLFGAGKKIVDPLADGIHDEVPLGDGGGKGLGLVKRDGGK